MFVRCSQIWRRHTGCSRVSLAHRTGGLGAWRQAETNRDIGGSDEFHAGAKIARLGMNAAMPKYAGWSAWSGVVLCWVGYCALWPIRGFGPFGPIVDRGHFARGEQLVTLAGEYGVMPLPKPRIGWPAAVWLVWVAGSVIALLFPNGQLVSRRWRVLAWLAVADGVLGAVGRRTAGLRLR
jgi:hypothetical protein